jgi:hypothetical protein
MTLDLMVPLLITAVVAVVGWYAAHRLSAKRDRANKRRELRVQYLIEAYRRLEHVSNRPIDPEATTDFEQAIADIQLFGTPRQVSLSREFAVQFARVGTHPLDPLLNDLRNTLRTELDLEPIEYGITYLRMSYDQKPGKAEEA